MFAYRCLFALGMLVAAGIASGIGYFLVVTQGHGGGMEFLLVLACFAATVAILVAARSLARKGRPGWAALLLLIPLLPALAAGAFVVWIMLVGFGPHH